VHANLQALTKSPRLNLLLSELLDFSEEEEDRRKVFYDEIEDGVKTEFINGEVIVHSPDKAKHIEVRERMTRLLGTHVAVHELGWLGGEKALTVFTRNDYMPDIVFFGNAKAAKIQDDTMKFPVPDFVVEILSPSTRKRDRGVKFDDYAGHGVREYWIVDPVAEVIEVWLLGGEGEYVPAARHTRGTVRAQVIKGFSMTVRAAFDDRENLKALSALLSK